MDAEKLKSKPPRRLTGFENYDEFVEYARSLFDLTPEEFEGLYSVLLKLQGLGQDPIETMDLWKKETCTGGCPEFIRFMIHVDNIDLEEFKAVA